NSDVLIAAVATGREGQCLLPENFALSCGSVVSRKPFISLSAGVAENNGAAQWRSVSSAGSERDTSQSSSGIFSSDRSVVIFCSFLVISRASLILSLSFQGFGSPVS